MLSETAVPIFWAESVGVAVIEIAPSFKADKFKAALQLGLVEPLQNGVVEDVIVLVPSKILREIEVLDSEQVPVKLKAE